MTDLKLPDSIITKKDLAYLVSEAERIDNEIFSDVVRSEVQHTEHNELQLSARFANFVAINEINLDDKNRRDQLIHELRELKNQAPLVHMTFATDVDEKSLNKLINWFRDSIHPQTILDIGLQPGIVAGAYIRTKNRVYDFTVGSLLNKNRRALVEKIEGLKKDD